MKATLLWLILWGGLCSPLAAQTLPPAVHQALYQSQQAQARGQDETEIRQPLEAVLAQGDKQAHPLLYLALGNSWYRQQQWQQALMAYREGARRYPRNPPLTLNRGVTAFHLQQFDEAARAFEQHATLVEQGSDSRYHAALAYAHSGQMNDCRRLMRSLAQTHPVMKVNWLQLWLSAEVDDGTPSLVQAALDRFLADQPAGIAGWQLQLQLALQQQQWEKALAALELLNRLGKEPNRMLLTQIYQQLDLRLAASRRLPSESSPKQRWRLLAAAGDLAGAAKVLSQQLQQQPTRQGFADLGQLYFRQGRWAEARQAFLPTGYEPLPAHHWLYAGYCALELGQLAQAAADFQQIDPASEHAAFAAAMVALLEPLQAEKLKSEKKI